MFNKVILSFLLILFSFNSQADLNKDAVNALIDRNYVTAIPLLKRLAKQGNPSAQYNLAIAYKQGLGVIPDYDKSTSYLSNSAHQGLVDSYRTLSVASIKPNSHQNITSHEVLKNNLIDDPQAWVRSQNGSYYTLQLASSTNAKLIEKYFSENNLSGKAGYYKNRREGEDWYALVYGAYPSVNLAKQAISSLPKDLRKWSPWVRKMSNIQRIMKN